MHTRVHPTPHPDDLLISAVSETRWRVFDRRLSGRSGIGLLGFVDFQDGRFVVTRFDSPSHDAAYDLREQALVEFLGRPGGREFLRPDYVPDVLSMPGAIPANAYSRVA